MKKKTAKILSLLCLFAVLATMITACGGNGPDTSGEFSIVYEDIPGVSTGAEASGETGENSATPSGGGAVGATTTSKTNGGGVTTTKRNSGSSSTVDASKYKGTTVKYATWKDWNLNEDGPVVKAFENQYGIKVEWVHVPQGGYISKILGYIEAGNAPDVYIETNFWPGSVGIAQSIDAAQIDMTDPIWDPTTFKNTTVNGKIYGVNTLGNIWSEAACLYYNKKLMKAAGIQTPDAYQKAGQWNLAACEKIMKQCVEKGYKGGYMNPEVLAAAYDGDWLKFENGKLINNSGSAMLTNVFKKVAEWNEKGYIVKQDSYFLEGNVGLCIGSAFGMKRTGTFNTMNFNDIGYIEMPAYDANTKAAPCGLTRFYGICKKAQNPVGAGIFLRYYLDSANYDLNKTFISTDAATFFFKVTSAAVEKKNCTYLPGVQELIGGFSHISDYEFLAYEPSAQVASKIKAKNNVIEGYCKSVNEFIAKNAK